MSLGKQLNSSYHRTKSNQAIRPRTTNMPWSCCSCSSQNSDAVVWCSGCKHYTINCTDCFTYTRGGLENLEESTGPGSSRIHERKTWRWQDWASYYLERIVRQNLQDFSIEFVIYSWRPRTWYLPLLLNETKIGNSTDIDIRYKQWLTVQN